MTGEITLKPVAYVKSAYTEIWDREWREIISEIHVEPQLVGGLQGIEEYSHLQIIFYLHKSPPFNPETDLQRHPRDRQDLPKRGIFAMRTNYRPNSIALTTVRLLRAENAILTVQGLDALDGTPVLDIKPYVPRIDEAENVCIPEWLAGLDDDPRS